MIWSHLAISSWLLPRISVSLSHVTQPQVLCSGVRPPLWSGPSWHHSLFFSHILLLKPLHSLFSLPWGNLLNLNPDQLSLLHNVIWGEPYLNHLSLIYLLTMYAPQGRGLFCLFVFVCFILFCFADAFVMFTVMPDTGKIYVKDLMNKELHWMNIMGALWHIIWLYNIFKMFLVFNGSSPALNYHVGSTFKYVTTSSLWMSFVFHGRYHRIWLGTGHTDPWLHLDIYDHGNSRV